MNDVFRHFAQHWVTEKYIRPLADVSLRTFGAVRSRTYDIRNTLIVASTGRGGSTWLTEILATLPGYTVLWEPLHLGNNPGCKQHGFDWQNYVPQGAKSPRKKAYLQKLLTGSNLSTRVLTSLEFRPFRLLHPRGGYLVKFVNANMMLPWLMEEFPVSGVLMIRHPCGVVASQLNHGAWDHVTKENMTIPAGLFERHPHLSEVFDDIDSHEEVLAFEWALQTYIPLNVPGPPPWFLTTYEDLVVNGPSTIEEIFEYLGRGVPEAAFDQLSTPSATASSHLKESKGPEQLRTWRERLSTEQIDRILRVVHNVGIKCYDNSLLPKRDALAQLSY